jgi:hypothetical protein
MAKKTVNKVGQKYTGTPKADVITVTSKKNATVSGAKGNDKITVKKGSGHKIYGAAGKDTIIIKAATGSKIYGDDAKGKIAGSDKITISGGKNNTIDGGKGADTITVNGGSGTIIYGGKGNDVFVIGKNSTGKAVVKDFRTQSGNSDKVKVSGEVKNIKFSKQNVIITAGESASLTLTGAKSRTVNITETNGEYNITPASGITMTLKKSYMGNYYAPSFVDNINVQSVSGISTVKGNAKKNQINAAWMDGGNYQGGAGDDVIIAKKGSSHRIYGDDESGTSKGNDRITVEGGNGHTIYGQYGNDIITVSYGANHYISGDDGNDTISVTEGHSHQINGFAGNDTITLNYVKGNGNGYSGNQTSCVYGGDGTDTIIVKNSSDVYVDGQNGVGKYTVEKSRNIYVQSNGDYGTFTVYSCADTTVRLNSTSGKNVNTVNVKGTGNSVTINQVRNAKDIITVNWSDSFGKLTIGAARIGDSEQYVDTLKINAAKSNFNFYKKDSDLRIVGKNGGEIYISGFSSSDNWMSFLNGINFTDGKVFAYKDFSNLPSK